MRVLLCTFIPLIAIGLQACVGVYKYTPTGPSMPPRPAACDFEVITTVPQRPFIELGVFDAEYAPADLPAFRDGIREQVCRAGADAVVVHFVMGRYNKATAIKWDLRPGSPGSK